MRNRKGNPQTERGTLNQKGESQSKPSGRDALKIHRLAVCFEFGGAGCQRGGMCSESSAEGSPGVCDCGPTCAGARGTYVRPGEELLESRRPDLSRIIQN